MNIINRVKNIITTPRTEWVVIEGESPNVNQIITGYVVPLTLIGAIAAFIGYGFIGFNVLGAYFGGIYWGIYNAVTRLVLGILSVYLTAFVVDALAPSFNSQKKFARSVQLVAYGATGLSSFLLCHCSCYCRHHRFDRRSVLRVFMVFRCWPD
jgi:hypothetical protein